MTSTSELPLRSLRVIDLSDGAAELCGRYLADLGAEVLRVEPPGGATGRRDEVSFGLRNANKLGATVDLDSADGRDRLLRCVRGADIVLESFTHAQAEGRRLTPQDFSTANPRVTVVSITDFGRTGPFRDYVATEDVLAAAGGVLSRSGLPGRVPLLPPVGVTAQTVGLHAAWAALVGYVKSVRTGHGEHVDVSALETVAHGFDPGFGTQGSAAAGRAETFPRDRPDAANFYPIYPCADGHVRICVLAKRQWHAMFAWLGAPAEFADRRYEDVGARFEAADRLNPLIKALFADRTRDELTAEGTRRGIPVAGVLTLPEVLGAEHFATTGDLAEIEIADGLRRTVPTGCVSIDGQRAGLRRRAPLVGEHDWALDATHEPPIADLGVLPLSEGVAPLHGLRVLDLGVIVFGAELARLFADQGADVIKVENRSFPDGLRQTRKGRSMNASFAWGHRNKRGLGLDLRSTEGAAMFRRLVAEADLVTANFKPGTLESLGLSYAELSAINPRIVVLDSSAFGNHGPWRERMGYGPLVRASCGLSALWRDPAADPADPDAFCDGSTVYPDHIAAHVGAVAALASVIGRGSTGPGYYVEVPQVSVALSALGTTLAAASQDPTTARAVGNRRRDTVPSGVYACAGDDEWCVITVRDDDDWIRLMAQTGLPDRPEWKSLTGRRTDREEIENLLGAWTATLTPADVQTRLQEAGIPAATMLRLPDLLAHPQLSARRAFGELVHPWLTRPVPTSARIAAFSTIPDPQLRPAPLPGEHTREVCASLLQMKTEDIDQMIAAGVLQPYESGSLKD